MRRVTWIDPDGVPLSLNFDDSDIVLQPGTSFAGAPPVRPSLDQVPLQSGSRWRYVDHGPRDLSLPIAMLAGTNAELETLMDRLTHATNPMRGDGRLRITRSDGDVRELVCRLIETMSIVERLADVSEWTGVLVLRAADPYYTDVSDTSVSLTTVGEVTQNPGTPASSFSDASVDISETGIPMNGLGATEGSTTFAGSRSFFPFFPLRLGSAESLSGFSVNNTGQVLVWPVWTIRGPATSISILNETTGESFNVAYTLAAGQTITIDTRPGRKVIVDQNGTSLFPITGNSSLFPLQVGANRISVTAVGSSAATAVVVRWRRRWLSA